MSQVRIQRSAADDRSLRVFTEFERRLNAVRERAYNLFASRGRRFGSDMDDWLAAEREVLGNSRGALKEVNGEYEVDLMLPGFRAEDVEVTATPTELIVHAASKKESSGTEGEVLWSEFGSSEVYRRFAMPTPVRTESIIADLSDGVLTVHAPKAAVSATPAPVSVPISTTRRETVGTA
jgi:HSP20 family molecular chaperone IbpA